MEMHWCKGEREKNASQNLGKEKEEFVYLSKGSDNRWRRTGGHR